SRCLSDWSSDVCSSDLEFRIATLLRSIGVVPDEEAPTQHGVLARVGVKTRHLIMVVLGRASGLEEQYPVTRPGEVRGQRPAAGRSEERRVGKERRPREG